MPDTWEELNKYWMARGREEGERKNEKQIDRWENEQMKERVGGKMDGLMEK